MLELAHISQAIQYEGGISRRLFLAYAASLSSIPWLAERSVGRVRANPSFSNDPFSLGVASGDSLPTSVVLWTRLAPKPLEPFGGMPPDRIAVRWEIASDSSMKNLVQSGEELAIPQLAHSIHAEVRGLEPDRWYWFRFRAGDAESVVGRTRTAPLPDSEPAELRFAFASCQHFEQGLYTAFEHMAKDELDLVFHLGDYIYEGPGSEKRIRTHVGPKLTTLEDYRIRHAQYRGDVLLQQAHARCPWVVAWDDHEFENNYAGEISERKGTEPAEFLTQRANSYQAYYEMLPLRRSSRPRGPDMTIYRTIPFGRLAQFQVLDTRQYRTNQVNNDRMSDIDFDALNPKNTMLGAKQANWLKGALIQSPATWNVLAQQVMMGMVDFAAGSGKSYSMDQWPGYAFERMKLVQFIAERRVPNPIVLTGDIHANFVNELRVDDRKAESPVVATEFVGTSISSGGNGSKEVKNLSTLLAENPCLKFHNRQRGYVRCHVTPRAWRSDYQIVEEVLKPGAPAETIATVTVEAGNPKVHL